jgi:hypothetical protein
MRFLYGNVSKIPAPDEVEEQSDISSDDHESDSDDILYPNKLDEIVDFLIKGQAFEDYKANLRSFVTPPKTMQDILEMGSLHELQIFLGENFDAVAMNEYFWLHELREAGYTMDEISEVLWEKAKDSPWIFGEQYSVPSNSDIVSGYHHSGCPHKRGLDVFQTPAPFSEGPQDNTVVHKESLSPVDPDEIRHLVHQLCGLGGVFAISRDRGAWNGHVSFLNCNTSACISYNLPNADELPTRLLLSRRIRNALTGFCTATAMVQKAGLCCDSFTILRRVKKGPGQVVVDMHRIYLRSAGDLLQSFQEIKECLDSAKVFRCWKLAVGILECLGDISLFERQSATGLIRDLDDYLHICALAVQFLCVGFVSYIQGHAGPIRPFFLDTPQSAALLCGGQKDEIQTKIQGCIIANLVQLSCIGEMVRDLVLVFSSVDKVTDIQSGIKHDVFASPEDLLDTWGPGQFFIDPTTKTPLHLYGLSIGGGILQSSPGRPGVFHWSDTDEIFCADGTFSINQKLLIGASVAENETCISDEQNRWENSEHIRVPLGTTRPGWECNGRQLGLQIGHIGNAQATTTWKKLDGTTLKDLVLNSSEPLFLPYLQSPWGLQISFCTGVARRVLLRELLADLMPIFVEAWPSMATKWEELLEKYSILDIFKDKTKDIHEWLKKIPTELQNHILDIVRTLLRAMKNTGVDRKEEHLQVAWLKQGETLQCLKIPCEQEWYWARMLADSDTCATFAYITPKCLESEWIKCRGPTVSWSQKSSQLETAVYRYCFQPLVEQRWVLKHDESYTIGKSDSLRVRVYKPSDSDKPRLHICRILIPAAYRFRLDKKIPKSLQKLREKQREESRAESVFISAPMIAYHNQTGTGIGSTN